VEIGIDEAGHDKHRSSGIGAGQVGSLEIGQRQICAAKVGFHEISVRQVGTWQVGIRRLDLVMSLPERLTPGQLVLCLISQPLMVCRASATKIVSRAAMMTKQPADLH